MIQLQKKRKEKHNHFALYLLKTEKKTPKLDFLQIPKMFLGVDLTSSSCQDQGVLFHLHFQECEVALNTYAGLLLPYSKWICRGMSRKWYSYPEYVKLGTVFHADFDITCKHLIYSKETGQQIKKSEILNHLLKYMHFAFYVYQRWINN